MAESDLTKRIKQLTHSYSPKINSAMRTIRWADEVWTPTDIGILAYFEGERMFGLRKYKPAGWRVVSEETKVLLLYNAMKKWCDGAIFLNS